jgi:ribose 5-phosphate isomerase B
MRLSFAADEKAPVAEALQASLQHREHEVTVVRPLVDEKMLWPAVARSVAEAVARGEDSAAILFCWSGTGVSLAGSEPRPRPQRRTGAPWNDGLGWRWFARRPAWDLRRAPGTLAS